MPGAIGLAGCSICSPPGFARNLWMSQVKEASPSLFRQEGEALHKMPALKKK